MMLQTAKDFAQRLPAPYNMPEIQRQIRQMPVKTAKFPSRKQRAQTLDSSGVIRVNPTRNSINRTLDSLTPIPGFFQMVTPNSVTKNGLMNFNDQRRNSTQIKERSSVKSKDSPEKDEGSFVS